MCTSLSTSQISPPSVKAHPYLLCHFLTYPIIPSFSYRTSLPCPRPCPCFLFPLFTHIISPNVVNLSIYGHIQILISIQSLIFGPSDLTSLLWTPSSLRSPSFPFWRLSCSPVGIADLVAAECQQHQGPGSCKHSARTSSPSISNWLACLLAVNASVVSARMLPSLHICILLQQVAGDWEWALHVGLLHLYGFLISHCRGGFVIFREGLVADLKSIHETLRMNEGFLNQGGKYSSALPTLTATTKKELCMDMNYV